MTAHKQRVTQVRQRIIRVLKAIPKNGRLTPHGQFADKMAEIARAQDTWLWSAKDLTNGGTPKDLSRAVRRFAEGQTGFAEKTLDLVELACIAYEREARERSKDTAMDYSYGGEAEQRPVAPVVPLTAFMVGRGTPEHITGHQELESGLSRGENITIPQDPEIAALHSVQEAIESLAPSARKRVLMWAHDKFVEGH